VVRVTFLWEIPSIYMGEDNQENPICIMRRPLLKGIFTTPKFMARKASFRIGNFVSRLRRRPVMPSGKTILLLLLLFLQGFMLSINIGAVPINQHSIGVHLDAQKLVLDGVFPLVSTQTIGQLGRYGPILTYLLAPFYLISPTFYTFIYVLIASYLAATVLIFYLGKDFINETTGWVSAIIFAFSTSTFLGAMNGFNSNFIPFFSLLLFYSLLQIVCNSRPSYSILALGSLSVLLQLHYTAFLALPVVVIVLIIGIKRCTMDKRGIHPVGVGIALFFLLFAPYILAEVQNDFVETKFRMNFLRGDLGSIGANTMGKSTATNVFENIHGYVLFEDFINPFAFEWRFECGRSGFAKFPFPYSLFQKFRQDE